MPATNALRDFVAQSIIGESVTFFNNANAHLGVGNGTAAFATSQTDLQGASKTRKAMDATFPTRATNVVTFKATFGTGDANYAWEETAVFNASSAGVMATRTVGNLGTKTSAASWVLTYTVTLAV
jgi:hypothetical protein